MEHQHVQLEKINSSEYETLDTCTGYETPVPKNPQLEDGKTHVPHVTVNLPVKADEEVCETINIFHCIYSRAIYVRSQ